MIVHYRHITKALYNNTVICLIDIMTIKLTLGPPVKGEDFYDREVSINEIWTTLEHSNILLSAPRKFGKTSIMKRLVEKPKKEFFPLFFEIEYIESPEEFIIELIDKIQQNENKWKKFKSGIITFFKRFGENIDEVDVKFIKLKLKESTNISWKDIGKHLFNLITDEEKKILFILDEFPEMIKLMIEKDNRDGTNETRIFLGWFRSIRQSLPEDVKLRFIVGGSICLENLLKQINCSAKINDMTKIMIGAFSEEKAFHFINALFDSEKTEIDDRIKEGILKNIGTPIPYFIQIIISAIVRESRNQNREITSEFVDEVYEKYLLSADYKSYFDYYYLRLGEYYSTIGKDISKITPAKKMLTEISIQTYVSKDNLYEIYLNETKQSEDEDGFGELISLLEDEFYIIYNTENESYSFLSKLLSDWWFRHFGILRKNVRE